VQSAKDTFYEVLRTRVAAVNPERTVVVRGVSRPGVLVVENELDGPEEALDCFRLSWGDVQVDSRGAMPMVSMACVVTYETAGTALNAGLDRGRMLSAMDGELLAVLQQEPKKVLKSDYSALEFGGSVTAKETHVWWGDASFGDVVVDEARLRRTVKVELMSYQETPKSQEAGEL